MNPALNGRALKGQTPAFAGEDLSLPALLLPAKAGNCTLKHEGSAP